MLTYTIRKINFYIDQNNARGGYNVGDSTDSRSQNEGQQYRMVSDCAKISQLHLRGLSFHLLVYSVNTV